MHVPKLAGPTAEILFHWLLQLDIREVERTIPTGEGASRLDYQANGRLVEELRMWSLLLAGHAPEKAKASLRAVADEPDPRKANAIRPCRKALSPANGRESG